MVSSAVVSSAIDVVPSYVRPQCRILSSLVSAARTTSTLAMQRSLMRAPLISSFADTTFAGVTTQLIQTHAYSVTSKQ